MFVGGIDLWKHEIIAGSDTTIIQKPVIEFENTKSYFSLLYFAGEFYNGILGAGTVPLEECTSVELSFGSGKSQKAHRFTVPSGKLTDIDAPAENFVYQDYVNVPFEVWDINNNVQLMVSFFDFLQNGEFELRTFNRDSSREYVYIHAVPYQTNPSNEISQIGGQTHQQLYHFWPFLMSRATWDAQNLPEMILRINCEKNVIKRFVTTNITDAYRQYGGSSKGVHVDHHNIILIPVNEETNKFRFLNANDGGVSFSDDGGKTFKQPLNGYNTTQFYGVDKMNGASRYIGGTQDNGTWVSPYNANVSSVWKSAPSGDGFETVWHYKDPNKLLESSQFNYIYRSLDGGQTWKTVTFLSAMTDVDTENAPFFTKIAKSKQNPDLILIMGASGIWRSEDFASTWKLIPMPTGFNGTSSFSEVKISLARPHIVWAGTGMLPSSPLYVSTDEGFTFKKTNTYEKVSLGNITGLETHPIDPKTAYALFSFANAPKILRTTDLGETWQEISGFGNNPSSKNGFPDVAVYSLLVMPYDPNIIWAGTEIGIFESTDNGTSWHYADNGLPATLVYEMLIVNDQVVVATHGRGVWSVTLPELAGYEPPVATLVPTISKVSGGGGGTVNLDIHLRSPYDSSFVMVDKEKFVKLPGNKTVSDTTVSFVYPVEDETTLSFSLSSYKDGEVFNSRAVSITLFPLLEARKMYITEFENQTSDFILNGFTIESSVNGFSNGAVHSVHPYPNSSNSYVLLKYPIIVSSDNSIITYDDVAIVEPGALFSRYGDENFKDYVVVEGSKNNGVSWLPLADGYDAFYNIMQWQNAFRNGNPGNSTMYKTHEIDITEVFSPGEEILIRFRLFADAEDNGWGWVIDNLSIQNDFSVVNTNETQTNKFVLTQNFPNPFNANTTIKYSIPRKNEVTLKILNTLGQEIRSLFVQKQHSPGGYAVIWDGKNDSGNAVSSGVYFYSLQAGEKIKIRKMLLLE